MASEKHQKQTTLIVFTLNVETMDQSIEWTIKGYTIALWMNILQYNKLMFIPLLWENWTADYS